MGVPISYGEGRSRENFAHSTCSIHIGNCRLIRQMASPARAIGILLAFDAAFAKLLRLLVICVSSHRCREEVETLKPEIQESTYTTFDDDDVSNTSAVAAYDAIDVSRPVSQTSLFTAVTESRK